MTSPGMVLGGSTPNIHDKSREGSWGGGGFNTKIYMTNPGRVLGGSTPNIHDKSREGSWGFNTKT